MPRAITATATALAAIGLLGCHAADLDQIDCLEDECDALDQADLLAAIEGFSDPFSGWVRSSLAEDRVLGGDYDDVLDGVGGILGCGDETERSFVVLSNHGMIPKMIFARCADDPVSASTFFMAAPAIKEGPDMDGSRLHVAAWDAEAGRYRHFATHRAGSGAVRVSVQPPHCLGCHGGPEQLSLWQPLMNEMTNPWSQWSADPGFRSQHFDEHIDPDIAAGITYREMRAPGRAGSAADLEPIVRAGIARFVAARTEARRQPADVDLALELLRPVYCDETVNYVSEIHRSGEIRTAAVVDDALRGLLAALRPGAWPFTSQPRFRLSLPGAGEETVVFLPTRGESTVESERSLLSRRMLEATDVLRVRALDYLQPVGSEFRCSLYRRGAARVAAGAVDAALDGAATTGDLVALVYREIMKVEDAEGRLQSLLGDDDTLVAFPDASAQAVIEALSAGDLSALLTGIDGLGDSLQARVDGMSRGALLEIRDERACAAEAIYPNAPLIPDLRCR